MINPKISVIMPVFNREKYICSAIDSVLTQTYENFELIIIDDGSTDLTVSLIEQYEDERIHLIKLGSNHGVAAARNVGYQRAKGEYIVIADSDDINLPNKLKVQKDFLDENSDIDIVGCIYKVFSDNQFRYDWFIYEDDEHIRSYMIFYPGIRAAAMFRKDKLSQLGLLLHDESYPACVDYEWYNKIPRNVKFANINEVLYLYRTHFNQISTNNRETQKDYAKVIRKEDLQKLFPELSELDFFIHNSLSEWDIELKTDQFQNITINNVKEWAEKLIKQNDAQDVYPIEAFRNVVARYFFRYCKKFVETYKTNFSVWDSFEYKDLIKEAKIDIDENKLTNIVKNKRVSVLGTLWTGALLVHALEAVNAQLLYVIDNMYDESSIAFDKYNVYKEDIINPNELDILILSTLSLHRFLLKDRLSTKFPQIKVLTVDSFMK